MPFINVNWQSFNFSKSHCTSLTQRHFNDVKKIKITNWSGLPFPSPGDLPNPGIKPRSPALQVDSLPTGYQGSPLVACSVQSLSRVRLFVTPWIAACQASLLITNFRSSFKLMSIESLTPSNHLILCCPLLLLPAIPPSIRVFSNESTLRTRWPKYWSFSFSISLSNLRLNAGRVKK